tara:strand:+ start:419 stop:1087 length:669 start_codon:yes stop_codon:yes gene_type:complete
MSNFDLKKYLAENKLLEEDLTSRAMSVIDSYKGKINGIKNYMRHLGNIPPSISDEDISKEIQKIIDNLGYSDVEESLKIDLENLSLAENKLVKEGNITITHNDVTGDSKSTVIDVSLIDDLINRLQPIVGNKTIEINNKMREDFIQTIVRRLTGYTDMGGGNVRINENNLNEEDEYTDEEILERTTVAQLPDNWTLLNVIDQYEDHILGYLRTSDIYGQELK